MAFFRVVHGTIELKDKLEQTNAKLDFLEERLRDYERLKKRVAELEAELAAVPGGALEQEGKRRFEEHVKAWSD